VASPSVSEAKLAPASYRRGMSPPARPGRTLRTATRYLFDDEQQLAAATVGQVWLPEPWPDGYRAGRYLIVDLNGKREWRVDAIGPKEKALGVSGRACDRVPARTPADVVGLPGPAWFSEFTWSSASGETRTATLAVLVGTTLVSLYGDGQTANFLTEVARTLSWIRPTAP
jgi:hypothetical protein